MSDLEEMIVQDFRNSERIQMSWEALNAVIERTQNFREGYFSIRRLVELVAPLHRPLVRTCDCAPEELITQRLQHQENVIATFATEIARLDS